MSDAGGVVTKAEMLAAAKKKLKDFESRRNLRENQMSPTSSVISSEPMGINGRTSVVSDDLMTSAAATGLQTTNQTNTGNNGNEWYQAYNKLKQQHDELCNHYGQLHSAYSQINANGVHVDAENQIIQLQAALSTMVEEKLACQSELRKTREELEKMRKVEKSNNTKNHEELHVNEEDKRNIAEIRNLLGKITEKDSLLSARQHELENLRREMSTIQANLLNIQHERSEAQARVKSLARDNSNLEKSMQELRKEIQMKELHLKQFGVHKIGDINTLNDDAVQKAKFEIDELKAEKSRLLSEAATLKSHYLEREQALQTKMAEMALELEQVHSHRFSSDDRVQQLENQLYLEAAEVKRLKTIINDEKLTSSPVDEMLTEEVVAKRVREVAHVERIKWEKRLEEEQRKRDDLVMEKDRIIFEREQSLAEMEMKYRLLEERTLEATANGADLLSLSEQLQNEKVTVSRAVAQNRELKAQLIETEDRLISVTEEKMQLQLDKQAAEHQVKELTRQLNLETAGLVTNISEVVANQTNVEKEEKNDEDKVDNVEEDADKTNLQIQLNAAVAELAQVRAELRRSNTQNEQMDEIMRQNAEDENQNSIHVELTQAVGRVNELAAENEQFREVVNDLSQQLKEERTRAAEAERKLNEQVVEKTPPSPSPLKNSRESEELWAKKELEKRFAKAMMQNADLIEQIDRLEHINQQLELENDTIADHVVLYQHQRKLIRERIRLKDEQLKAMEEERTRTVGRCQELQNVLMTVLSKGGVLKEYETNKLAKRIARKVSRSYSHSTVDETSGDEEVIINGKDEIVPKRENFKKDENKKKMEEVGRISPELKRADSPTTAELTAINESEIQQEASVRRILEIISDISNPQTRITGELHCTQCIGEMQEV